MLRNFVRTFFLKLRAILRALFGGGRHALPAVPPSLTILHFNDIYNIEGIKGEDGRLRGGAARFLSKVMVTMHWFMFGGGPILCSWSEDMHICEIFVLQLAMICPFAGTATLSCTAFLKSLAVMSCC